MKKVTPSWKQSSSNMTVNQLKSQIKGLRKFIDSINSTLNKMLKNYIKSEPLEKQYINETEMILKEKLLIEAKEQVNKKIISIQHRQLDYLQTKTNDFQYNDYFQEYDQLITETKQQISKKKKESHEKWVDVEKLNKKLINKKQKLQCEDKDVSLLKKQIIVLLKKFHENQIKLESLDEKQQQLQKKSQKQNKKLVELKQGRKFMNNSEKVEQKQIMLKDKIKELQKRNYSLATCLEKRQDKIKNQMKELQSLHSIFDKTISKILKEYEESEEKLIQLIEGNSSAKKKLASISYKFRKREENPSYHTVTGSKYTFSLILNNHSNPQYSRSIDKNAEQTQRRESQKNGFRISQKYTSKKETKYKTIDTSRLEKQLSV